MVVTVSVAVSLVLGTLAAYPLARFHLRFGLNQSALVVALLVRMLPAILLVIPFYIMLAQVGPAEHAAGADPDLLRPQHQLRDLDDAELPGRDPARHRGGGDGRRRLPADRAAARRAAAGRAGLAATAIFSVIATYNDFLIALSLTSTPDAQTVPVGVSTLIGKIQIE